MTMTGMQKMTGLRMMSGRNKTERNVRTVSENNAQGNEMPREY